MSKLKTIFMGTPDFAVPCLEVLQAKTEVLAVITQPDRPKGRGHNLQASPVKQKALEYNLPVLQPEKIKTEEFTAELEKLQPDLIVVVAFGQILSQRILDIPPLGCVNVHLCCQDTEGQHLFTGPLLTEKRKPVLLPC